MGGKNNTSHPSGAGAALFLLNLLISAEREREERKGTNGKRMEQTQGEKEEGGGRIKSRNRRWMRRDNYEERGLAEWPEAKEQIRLLENEEDLSGFILSFESMTLLLGLNWVNKTSQKPTHYW